CELYGKHIPCSNEEFNSYFDSEMSLYGAGASIVATIMGGNVGIGTTNPGSKLTVVGNLIVLGGSQYPPAQSDTYVKATTYTYADYAPWLATDPTKVLTGLDEGNSWMAEIDVITNQRFHIDLGSAKIIRRIYYENYHCQGSYTIGGVKNFTFWGSNTAGDFS
ncbi:unnamed protein product, partial [marine sediment metagenome]